MRTSPHVNRGTHPSLPLSIPRSPASWYVPCQRRVHVFHRLLRRCSPSHPPCRASLSPLCALRTRTHPRNTPSADVAVGRTFGVDACGVRGGIVHAGRPVHVGRRLRRLPRGLWCVSRVLHPRMLPLPTLRNLQRRCGGVGGRCTNPPFPSSCVCGCVWLCVAVCGSQCQRATICCTQTGERTERPCNP